MIPREMYMSRIRPFIGSELIKVMTGIRRCGKSVMLELIKQELTSSGICPSQFISINFENMGYAHLQTAKALHDEILKRAAEIGGKVYLFFDEIQEVKDWEKCVNSLRVALDCDIYITGSNAKLLSGELATYLGGRYVEFVIYPFSFAEFMELYRSILPDEPVQKCFQKYLLSGGMPYLANIRYAEEPSRQYLHDLFRSIQLKDIVQRNKIRDVDLLERIIAYVMAHVGTTFSATSLAKYWKSEQRAVAPETILNYLKYCCDAYLFYQVKREDLQGKQILASNEKYYLADHGIREAVFGGNTRDINLILENIVYQAPECPGLPLDEGVELAKRPARGNRTAPGSGQEPGAGASYRRSGPGCGREPIRLRPGRPLPQRRRAAFSALFSQCGRCRTG